MSQSAPRRAAAAAAAAADRRQSNSPAQELKRKMATATVLVEKDAAIDRRCEANGDREAREKTTDGKSKTETKPSAPESNGDTNITNGKPVSAATDGATQGGARPEGTDIPPTVKQTKHQEGDKAVSANSDKDAKKEDKNSTKKVDKDSKKDDKKATDKVEKDSKKEEKKVASKQDSEAKNDEKETTKKEDKMAATNGDESTSQESGERRKPDTNYSLSRVKISPYRRGRGGDAGDKLGDTTGDLSLGDCSTLANYAGNNSTMEADVSAPSPALGAGSLRALRGRASYRALGELSLSFPRAERDSLSGARPTAPVVGRKRAAPGHTPSAPAPAHHEGAAHSSLKRARLTQMVGINSDLPLCGPAGSELESLKPAGRSSSDSKSSGSGDRRCTVM